MSMYEIVYVMNSSEFRMGGFRRIRDARDVLKMVKNEYMREGERALLVKDCLHIVSEKNGNRKYIIRKI